VTGLSGSGPGYIAMVVESLTAGGVAAGLPEPLALALAKETLAGTAALLEQSGDHPAEIRRRVCSPGGTTLAGLEAMEQAGVARGLAAGVIAARDRARELGDG
jgi:pyrroline-5-carboxylate reductase